MEISWNVCWVSQWSIRIELGKYSFDVHDVRPSSLQRHGKTTQESLEIKGLKSDLDKVPGSLKTIGLGPTLQRPCSLQRHGATLLAKIQQRRLRRCSSCWAVGQVCTLPTVIDSLDSNARPLRHRVCSLQSAAVFSQSLPLVTFISKRRYPRCQQRMFEPVSTEFDASGICHARCQQRISEPFRQNLMPVGLASIATSRLLNQCSARQHSKWKSKCLQLKKWMDDPVFQTGAVFCLFCACWHKLDPFQHVQVSEIAGDCRCFGAWKTYCGPLFAMVRILLGICRWWQSKGFERIKRQPPHKSQMQTIRINQATG